MLQRLNFMYHQVRFGLKIQKNIQGLLSTTEDLNLAELFSDKDFLTGKWQK